MTGKKKFEWRKTKNAINVLKLSLFSLKFSCLKLKKKGEPSRTTFHGSEDKISRSSTPALRVACLDIPTV